MLIPDEWLGVDDRDRRKNTEAVEGRTRDRVDPGVGGRTDLTIERNEATHGAIITAAYQNTNRLEQLPATGRLTHSMRHSTFLLVVYLGALLLCDCSYDSIGRGSSILPESVTTTDVASPEIGKLMESAASQRKTTRGYSQKYFVIGYPNGDVPSETGACTDVIIRSFRNAGIDLQKEVHEDMAANFSAYPNKWGLAATDKNIDHRRVPNLQTFFTRKGKSIAVSLSPDNYKPGDVVSWDLDGKGMTHIGLVSNLRSSQTGRFLIVHNIGGGVNIEDRLFDWKVTGHYRYF